MLLLNLGYSEIIIVLLGVVVLTVGFVLFFRLLLAIREKNRLWKEQNNILRAIADREKQ